MDNPLFNVGDWSLGSDTAGGSSGYDIGGAGGGDLDASHGFHSSWALVSADGSGKATLNYVGPPITEPFSALLSHSYTFTGDGPAIFTVVADGVTVSTTSALQYPAMSKVTIPACTTLILFFQHDPNTDFLYDYLIPIKDFAFSGNPLTNPDLWTDITVNPSVPGTLDCWDGTEWNLGSTYPSSVGIRYNGTGPLDSFSFDLVTTGTPSPFVVVADGTSTSYPTVDGVSQTIVVPPCQTLLMRSGDDFGGGGSMTITPIDVAPPVSDFWTDFIGAVES